MFRWLIEQRYLLANPFAGVKVRGTSRSTVLDTSHAFTEGEWLLARAIADGLEWSYGREAGRRNVCVSCWTSLMRPACASANWSVPALAASKPTPGAIIE
ncbi:hypothetical protein B0G74_8985 [Paraburkholderia sp. BL9I2N2]|nr:hypothetical protein B0G74_8985 [Paraburkholderia sp. BL9I2N2]